MPAYSGDPGYRLHPPDSPEAEALLAEQGLTRADLDRALADLERTEGIAIRTIVGINQDGVFGTSREGWRPDLPDACAEPFIPLLWLKVLELLGRVPEGSTARFIRDGTLPGDRSGRCHRLPAGQLRARSRGTNGSHNHASPPRPRARRRFSSSASQPRTPCSDPTNACQNPAQRAFTPRDLRAHPRPLRADAGCLMPPRRAFWPWNRRYLGNVDSTKGGLR